MTRIWKLEEAKTHLSQLIRQAEQEPQVITRHGKPVAVVRPVAEGEAPRLEREPRSAWEALRGDFDFSEAPGEEDLFPRVQGGLRDLDL